MGAELSLLAPTAPSIAVSAYVDVLDQIQYHKQIGSSRFLKTIKATDNDGTVVVKVFIKPNENQLQLSKLTKKLQKERDTLLRIPGTLPFQKIFETDRAGYLIRQYFKTSLYDRISTRPFLKGIEKKWIVFQMLKSLESCHKNGVVHGDLKTENILVTSWNWTLLSDFASFKPVFLPIDNPGIFSFYFDTSQRRSCYLAPERFIGKEENVVLEENLDSKMDIFSLGCVIAELFHEGSPTLTLSQMFKYKNGEFKPNLSGIKNTTTREMVSNMLSLDPKDRSSASEYLERYKKILFPESFYDFIYDYFAEINSADSTMKFRSVESCVDCDKRISNLYHNFERVIESLGLSYDTSAAKTTNSITGCNDELLPIKLSLPGIPADHHLRSTNQICKVNDGCLIFLSLAFVSLRNARSELSKIQALELILALSEHLSDEDKLDRCIPYVVDLLEDPSVNVKTMAMKSLTQLLLLVCSITSINIEIFPEYIVPRLIKILQDKSVYVRMIFANCFPYLAQTSLRFLDYSKLLTINSKLDSSVILDSTNSTSGTVSKSIIMAFDASKQRLLSEFESLSISLLTDPDSSVKIALLQNILPLCSFFGQDRTNDLILLHLITYLNDKDPSLRVVFIESVIGLSIFVGVTSLEHYILPLLVQTLTDPEERVVVKVLGSFNNLIKLGLIRNEFIWDLVAIFTKLILHPNDWIKQFSIQLIVEITENLSFADVYCMLYPLLRQYIEYDVTEFTWDTLYSITKRQISRQVYNLCLSWSGKAGENSLFWRKVKSDKLDVFGNNGWEFSSVPLDYMGSTKRSNKNHSIIFGNSEIPLSAEDKIWIEKIVKSGLSEQELWKIADFRDYIYRVSTLLSRANSQAVDHIDILKTQQLGVLPKNVFFDTKRNDLDPDNFNTIDIAQLDERFQSLDIPESINSNPDSLIDDRLLNYSSILNNNGLEMTRIPSLPGSTEDPTKSLIIGVSSKATATINMNDENAYGQMNASSSSEQSHNSKNNKKSNNVTIKAKQLRLKIKSDIIPISHSYIGKDPYILKFLNSVKFEPSLDEYKEFQKLAQRPKTCPLLMASGSWVPQGQVVSRLIEHEAAITTLDISPDNKVFITGDVEGFIKIWDASKLEMNVSQDSLLTVDLSSPVIKLKYLKDHNSFVVATEDGQIRIMSLKFGKSATSTSGGSPSSTTKPRSANNIVEQVIVIRQMTLPNEDEYVLDLITGKSSKLKQNIYIVTTLSKIYTIDSRTMTTISILQNNPSCGYITSLDIDDNHSWLVVGTSRGVISVWDLRFNIILRTWKFANSSNLPIRQLKSLSNNYQLGRKKGRFFVVNDGVNIYVVDVSQGLIREVLEGQTTSADADSSNEDMAMKHQLTDIQADSDLLQGTNDDNKNEALYFTSIKLIESETEGGTKQAYILTANAKREFLVWNLHNPEHSTKFLNAKITDSSKFQYHQFNSNLRVTKEYIIDSRVKQNVQSKTHLTQLQSEQDLKRNTDLITSIDVVFNSYEMILSCDRFGNINVYK